MEIPFVVAALDSIGIEPIETSPVGPNQFDHDLGAKHCELMRVQYFL